MNKIKLSLEELIFAFYSEGLFESGIQLKDTYFPDLDDRQLQLLLEIASRSLMAKDMIREVDNRYRLKEEEAEFIHVLNRAEFTLQFSCFSADLTKEETLSIHFKNQQAYIHKLHFDEQVHTIECLADEDAQKLILAQLSSKEIQSERTIIAEMSTEEFENLLEEASETDHPSSFISRWSSQIATEDIQGVSSFLLDVYSRSARLNTMLLMSYDQHNSPETVDICFFIPGQQRDWMITRNKDHRFNLEHTNEAFLKTFIPSSIFKVNINI
ncbi:hypothetical protein SAMN05443252_101368 [Bacillus sp. OV322]|uniref:hypothetical protein n=1 Tax=Bacillus sp. OV322 TaxID=1882764 RepID=UPI0008E7ED59|nr:hypothetical protein [Bacillus sp. OV322]SFB99595.1 hypothetical protein SAMN05443252_101368 [Bacillus sp. OV322]